MSVSRNFYGHRGGPTFLGGLNFSKESNCYFLWTLIELVIFRGRDPPGSAHAILE